MIFDLWSIQHFLSGVAVGPFFKKKRHKSQTRYSGIMAVGMIAYLWEWFEFQLEKGLLGSRVKYWLHGVEIWPNRLFADPFLMIVGFLIAKKYPGCVRPMRWAFLTWFLVHAFVFPHSMYLQEIL